MRLPVLYGSNAASLRLVPTNVGSPTDVRRHRKEISAPLGYIGFSRIVSTGMHDALKVGLNDGQGTDLALVEGLDPEGMGVANLASG